jgi:2-polyprenyl-3-methyl-5-hydroxy-6-metoxy-1,4-benzoquinol methylase
MGSESQDQKYKEFLDRTYRELLLRSPDPVGFKHYLSLLKDQGITMEEVRNLILNSEECKSIRSFSHYSDKYWNNLETVKQYKNKLTTGDSRKDWIEDIVDRFKNYLPFKNVLIVGCGNGWVERRLYDLGIGLHFDAFDISEEYLETAIKAKGDRPIRYFVSDINNMENINNYTYDAVFNYAILHHAENIEYAIEKLSKVLKPGGLIFNEEYVGPSRNQYSDEHLAVMHQVMSQLPERLRSKHPLRPNIENFRVEPSEAIHSDMIRSIFSKYFDITYERDLNGGVAYQILWNNIDGFKDASDKEAMN